MKNKFAVLLLAVALIGTSLSSCGKYEEGPAFSLLTKKARLTGVWDEKEEVDSDGTVYTDNSSATIEFTKSGSYILSDPGSSLSLTGEWEFTSNKEKLRVSYEFGGTQIEEFTILRLTNKELWVKDNDNYQYRYEKKK
jgi:hypothetical protein